MQAAGGAPLMISVLSTFLFFLFFFVETGLVLELTCNFLSVHRDFQPTSLKF